jgi:hypothetical protein
MLLTQYEDKMAFVQSYNINTIGEVVYFFLKDHILTVQYGLGLSILVLLLPAAFL